MSRMFNITPVQLMRRKKILLLTFLVFAAMC